MLLHSILDVNSILSYIFYNDNEKFTGQYGRSRGQTNPENVLFDSKILLAETMDSPRVKELKALWPFEITNKADDTDVKKVFYRIYTDEKKYQLISPEIVSRDILNFTLHDAYKKFKIENNQVEVVIAVSACFTTDQRRATMEIAQAAGIPVKRLVSEPVAAALICQNEIKDYKVSNKLKDGELVFIFDLGGGTFDAVIMKMGYNSYNVIAVGGDNHLGGRDFDTVIATMIRNLLKQQIGSTKVDEMMQTARYRYRLLKTSEQAKYILSQDDD